MNALLPRRVLSPASRRVVATIAIAAALGAFWLLGLSVAQAGPVMRWVDDKGVVNYGEIVPEKYRGQAKAVEIQPNQTTMPAVKAPREPPPSSLSDPRAPRTGRDAVPLPTVEVPRSGSSDPARASCEEQWRAYDAAYACLDPYRNANGSVKEEGYKRCPVVKEPEPCR